MVKDWNTNAVIDLDPNTPYPQIGVAQIGRKLRITIIDPILAIVAGAQQTLKTNCLDYLLCS